ncbi:MAG TPA: efflux RND transporter periplasmic adaptor subunit [Bacteroidia bacterium]|nr:efflux RND transporter periplasmic adaptor subunit [Bacteroidia bacterium]
MKTIHLLLSTCILLFASCSNKEKNYDASGSFEADEIIISSEANGTIKLLQIEEGQSLNSGELIGYIDSIQLYLKKKQLLAQIKAALSKKPNIDTQIAALEEQIKTSEKEQIRISKLVKADAATTKQLDDINANIEVLKKQLLAQKSTLAISSEGINQETAPINFQIEQVNDQIRRCQIINPIKGTVLAKYVSANEIAAIGKPLYKIANLSVMVLRVYISGNQLSQIKLNQKVKVKTDDGNGGFKETQGQVIWINDKAEFTPKTIQTKDERANLVYAVKVKVNNDGSYKIGMYGEISFQ